LLFVGALNPLLITHSNFEALYEGNAKFQIISGLIYIISASLLLMNAQPIPDFMKSNIWLLIFVLYVLISSIWSEIPGVSIRRSIALLGTTIFSVYLAARFQPKELYRLLAFVLMILTFESLFLGLFLPSVGTDQYFFVGAWHGPIGYKNDFGRIMVLAAIFFWTFSDYSKSSRPVYFAFSVMSIALAIMSSSRSAWLVAACLFVSMLFFSYISRHRGGFTFRATIVICVLLLLVIFVVVPYLEQIFLLVDRDITLTGRTHIWLAAFDLGVNRPWLGHGYRTFWTDQVRGGLIIDGHAPNSFLDLWLELGLIGLVLFLLTFIVVSKRAVQHMKQLNDKEGFWYVLFFTYFALYGTVAQNFPNHGSITWILYVTSAMYLSSVAKESRTILVHRHRRMIHPN